jgi:ribonuclease III
MKDIDYMVSTASEESQANTVGKARKQQILALLKSLNIKRPKNYALYDRALTHSSYTYENKLSAVDNYERLEYLGDAVLKLVVSEYLFERFPDYREGELTKIRAVVVSDAKLAEIAKTIGLGAYIIFGSSEAKSGGRKKVSNLACAFEALLGAMYLDGKILEVRDMMCEQLETFVTQIDMSKTKDNYKAALQELTQADGGVLPAYRTIKESGPSHNRTFQIEVSISGEIMGIGFGKSKKEAQQQAARQALEVLNELDTE